MNWLQFTSSLISILAWPLVVIILVVIFRRQLAHLIGRIKSYKGMGQELTFGDRLADAENSVEEAVSSDTTGKTDPEQADEIEPNPLALEAEANPSFVVIRSYEQVVSALSDLAGVAPQKVNQNFAGRLRCCNAICKSLTSLPPKWPRQSTNSAT